MEILVKGKAGSKWVQGGFMNWNGVPHILTERLGEMIPVRKETVSLGIGKTDCNGKDIFAGDIIRHSIEIDNELFKEDFIIVWDDKLCSFLAKSTDEKIKFPADIDDLSGCIEIIGNIFDKPKKRKAKSVN